MTIGLWQVDKNQQHAWEPGLLIKYRIALVAFMVDVVVWLRMALRLFGPWLVELFGKD